jgi:hypothetical protein
MATFKIQSAMEYLMTYGWALLIISIVVVALVSIGVFNGNPLGTTCIATAGFTCQVVQYASGGGSVSGGNIVVTIGQDSGTAWSTANVVFVNASQEASVQSVGLSAGQLAPPTAATLTSGLSSGVTTTLTLPASGPVRVGSGISGYIWVSYSTSASGGATTQAQIASITAKAT